MNSGITKELLEYYETIRLQEEIASMTSEELEKYLENKNNTNKNLDVNSPEFLRQT